MRPPYKINVPNAPNPVMANHTTTNARRDATKLPLKMVAPNLFILFLLTDLGTP